MPSGRPRKKNKNTSGLKQNQTFPSISMFDEGSHVDRSRKPSPLADDRNLKDIFNSETESVLDCEIDEDCETEEEDWSDGENSLTISQKWPMNLKYRRGLTGKAAAWAVQKQRQHRQVSERARM